MCSAAIGRVLCHRRPSASPLPASAVRVGPPPAPVVRQAWSLGAAHRLTALLISIRFAVRQGFVLDASLRLRQPSRNRPLPAALSVRAKTRSRKRRGRIRAVQVLTATRSSIRSCFSNVRSAAVRPTCPFRAQKATSRTRRIRCGGRSHRSADSCPFAGRGQRFPEEGRRTDLDQLCLPARRHRLSSHHRGFAKQRVAERPPPRRLD